MKNTSDNMIKDRRIYKIFNDTRISMPLIEYKKHETMWFIYTLLSLITGLLLGMIACGMK